MGVMQPAHVSGRLDPGTATPSDSCMVRFRSRCGCAPFSFTVRGVRPPAAGGRRVGGRGHRARRAPAVHRGRRGDRGPLGATVRVVHARVLERRRAGRRFALLLEGRTRACCDSTCRGRSGLAASWRPTGSRCGSVWTGTARCRRAARRPRSAPQPRARSGRARRSSSAPTAAIPAPTARRRCSRRAASRRATARRCRGCSPAAATGSGAGPPPTAPALTSRANGSRSPRAPMPARSSSTSCARRLRPLRCGRSAVSPACRRCCPSGATASGRAATSTSTRTTCSTTSSASAVTTSRSTPIVIDSPWATQYNTWEFNPHQFPDAPWMICSMRAAGVRTVVWVTPWVNLDSRDGQIPPQPESERAARAAGLQLRAGGGRRPFRPTDGPPTARRTVRRAVVDGHRLAGRLHEPRPPRRGGASRPSACSRSASTGSRPTTATATTSPTASGWPTGARAARRRGSSARCTAARLQRALDEVHPGEGVLFGRSGWSGQHALGLTWGGDQASDFWSLRVLVVARLAARAPGSRTSPTTSAAISATGWSSAARPSCSSAGCSSAASPR